MSQERQQATSSQQKQAEDAYAQEISPKILQTFADLINVSTPKDLIYETQAIAGAGENSYGLILQIKITPITTGNINKKPLKCVLKIAPKLSARRNLMRVADYYQREVFMYTEVFKAYRELAANNINKNLLDILPTLLAYSLEDGQEFIIFEDLIAKDFIPNIRIKLPTQKMVEAALETLAKFHALSFALQFKQALKFEELIKKLQPDNLFTTDIEAVSIEFGKSYIRRARNLLIADKMPTELLTKQLEVLNDVETYFKEIPLRCVNGAACAPYAVICHGDFWNNNLMNKFEVNTNNVLDTKLVDFQMSRYASPILDLVHYLFICTEHELRQRFFHHFLYVSYYENLAKYLKFFDLNCDSIYPRSILEKQLKSHGAYGLCMAAFSLPFFVADQTDLFDIDEISKAVEEINPNINTDENVDSNESHRKLIEDFDLLTPKTAPIFKRRMIDIVDDLIKYKIETKL